jgi:hypothetical protein
MTSFSGWSGTLLAIALTLSSTPTSSNAEAKPMIPCTPSIEPGITATVTNARTQAPLQAKIVIQEGKFQETLKVQGATVTGQTIYGGAYERPGTYTLTVSKPGYQTLVMKAIQIARGECHVVTRQLNLQLKPL